MRLCVSSNEWLSRCESGHQDFDLFFSSNCSLRSNPTRTPSVLERSLMILLNGTGNLRTKVGMASIWWSRPSCGVFKRSITSIQYLPFNCASPIALRLLKAVIALGVCLAFQWIWYSPADNIFFQQPGNYLTQNVPDYYFYFAQHRYSKIKMGFWIKETGIISGQITLDRIVFVVWRKSTRWWGGRIPGFCEWLPART